VWDCPAGLEAIGIRVFIGIVCLEQSLSVMSGDKQLRKFQVVLSVVSKDDGCFGRTARPSSKVVVKVSKRA